MYHTLSVRVWIQGNNWLMYPENQPGSQVIGDLEIQFRTSPIYAESNPSLLEGPMILGVGSSESHCMQQAWNAGRTGGWSLKLNVTARKAWGPDSLSSENCDCHQAKSNAAATRNSCSAANKPKYRSSRHSELSGALVRFGFRKLDSDLKPGLNKINFSWSM